MKIKWKSIGIKELAAIVSDKLSESGIDAILVGGGWVEIRSKSPRLLASELSCYNAGRFWEGDFLKLSKA